MKGKYIALIVAGGLMVAGAGIGAAAVASSAFNIENMTKEEDHMEKTFDIADSFKDIKIDVDSANVTVLHSTDGKAKVETSVPKGYEVSVNTESDALKVIGRDERKWNMMIFSFAPTEIKVYLPGDEYADLKLENHSGNVQVEGGFTFDAADVSATSGNVRFSSDVNGNLSLASHSGRVECENVVAKDTRIEATSGNIKITNLEAANLVVKNTSGSIHINGLKADGAKVEGNSGNTHITGAQIAGDINVSRTSGGTDLEDVIAGGELNATTSSGNIHLTGCDAASLALEASSGNINAELLTNKEINATSKSGTVSLPEDGGEKNGTLTVKASSGNIKIRVR